MKTNPLSELESFGQAIWLDYIKRDMLKTGKLKQLIKDECLRGMTSNPSIFEKSIAESNDYDSDIKKMSDTGKDTIAIYEALTQQDVRDAAHEFLPLYNETQGADGYVSLEVNPHLSHDTHGTIKEARCLWQSLNMPNVLIKVPATREGLAAIEQLISEGININVTLLFGLERYREVAEAYIKGLELRLAQKQSIKQIASVASFFLSRIDVLLDPILEESISKNPSTATDAQLLLGQVAIASAKKAYQIYNEIFNSARFKKLVGQGAKVQRLLWASTSTKNPKYSDIKYVEALIGPDTVNTLPLETIEAYHDHGKPQLRLKTDLDLAELVFQKLPACHIDITKVTEQLEQEGLEKFVKSYDTLIETLADKMQSKEKL